jgi:WD40 repeat protein
VTGILWDEERIVSVENGRMLVWSLDTNTCGLRIPLGDNLTQVGGAALNPHFSSVLGVCVGNALNGFDTRQDPKRPVWSLPASNRLTDCSFNPNRPYWLCCGGENGKLLFWDYRNPKEPIEHSFADKEANHTHWISGVEYNPHHDSLVLSSGTDGAVKLYNAKSVSSAPATEGGGGGGGAGGDYLISNYDRFNESVYTACWSSADAWIYAAVSYDGKALIETVPDAEKMKILL